MEDEKQFKHKLTEDFPRCDFRKKDERHYAIMSSYLERTIGMFDYSAPNINWEEVEYIVQTAGAVAIAPYKGDTSKPVVLPGGFTGLRNSAGFPYRWRFASAVLDWSGEIVHGENGIIIKNTPTAIPTTDFIAHYVSLAAETELSLYLANINSRVQNAVIAGNDNDKTAAELYLDDVESGKIGVLLGQSIFNALKSTPLSGNTGAITDLIELYQYTNARSWNELGLDLNFNMKRESIAEGEAEQNRGTLETLPDIMMKTRKRALEAWENVFGDTIEIEFSGAWKTSQIKEKEEPENEDPDTE